MVDGVNAWVCPSDACYERQIVWKILDLTGKLFYLPMPRLVELEEAVASQRYGAICLGGDRSGGKSVGLRALIYRYLMKIPNFAAILLRREFPQLELNHMRFVPGEAKRLGLTYADKTLKCPETNGLLKFGHCHAPKDYASYIGGDVDLIAFGQLEQFAQEQFTEIAPSTGRIRRDDWRGLVLAEENPGGPLSAFVETFFVSKNPDPKKYPDYDPTDHHFIASQLDDNPYTDPRYVKKLANLTYERREMMRYGRRDIFPRQMFPQWRTATHVLERDLPFGVKYLRALHWGHNAPGLVLWLAVLPTHHVHVRAELEIERLDESEVAQQIKLMDRSLSARPGYTAADPPVFNVRPMTEATFKKQFIGPSIAEVLGSYGIVLTRGDDDVINGWKRLQSYLRPSPDGTPWLTVDPSCEHLITSLRTAMNDEKIVEDLDPAIPAPGLHALRHALMSRPSPLADPLAAAPAVGSIGWHRRKVAQHPSGPLASRSVRVSD